MLTLQALRVFVAVVEEGGFSAAADRLGVTQPAVSAQMRGLSEHFGQPLVERSPQGAHPTAAGQRLYTHAVALLGRMETMEHEIAALREEPAGPLRLVASTVPGEVVVPRLLGVFCERHPKVRACVEVADSAEAVKRVLARRADVAIIGDEVDDERLASQRIAGDRLVLVAGRRHPLAARRRVGLTELPHHRFVVREVGSGTRAVVERALARAGLSPAELPVTMELGSTDAIKRAVAAGAGLSFLSCFAAVDDDDVVVVDIDGFSVERPLSLITERRRVESEVVKAFRRFLTSKEVNEHPEIWRCACTVLPT